MSNNIDDVLAAIQERVGKTGGGLGLLNDVTTTEPTLWVPSGITLLDAAIGKGGIPLGKIIEVFGWEQTGKSALLYSILAKAQDRDAIVCLLDSEAAANQGFAEGLCGLDTARCLYQKVKAMETAFELAETTIQKARSVSKDRPIFLGIDSIGALSTLGELKAAYAKAKPVGDPQRVIKHSLRRLCNFVDEMGATLIATNHQYDQIPKGGWAPSHPEPRTYGGHGFPYFASLRIRLEALSKIREDNREVGVEVRVTIKKSRFGPQGRRILIPIRYATGINDVESLVLFLEHYGALGNKPGWYVWEGKNYRLADFVAKVGNEEALRVELATKATAIMTDAPTEDDPEGTVEGAE